MQSLTAANVTLLLPGADATEALGRWFEPRVQPGDTLLLKGPIGAGKTQFARALIQARMARSGEIEDVPSPTYTLVQTYGPPDAAIWHADLYRLTSPDEVLELGLDQAFDTAVCLIEWPDRLGDATPADALTLDFSDADNGAARRVRLGPGGGRWSRPLADLATEWADARD